MKEILESILKKSTLVVSGTFSMPWIPSGIGDNNNFLKLKTKLNDRVYLGIIKTKKKKVTFNKVYFLDKKKQNFEELGFINVTKEIDKEEKYIENYLLKEKINYGFEINIYSEIPRGYGMGFSGVVAGLISSSLFLLNKEITKKELENPELLNNKLFKDLYDIAFDIEKILKYNNTNGENSFMFFVNNPNPILFSRNIDKINYLDIFDGEDIMLPFDYYILFSGNKSNTKKIESYLKKDEIKFDNLGLFFKKEVLLKLKSSNENIIKLGEKGYSYSAFEKSFSVLNIKLIKAFKEIQLGAYSEKLTEDFIAVINEHRNLLAMIEGKTDFAINFIDKFYKNAGIKEKIGVVPIYSAKMGGGFLVVTKEGLSRDTINTTIENINPEYPRSYIEYSSYKNLKNNFGIKVEQNIENGLYSNIIPKGLLLCTKSNKILVNDIKEALKYDFDILLDTLKNKVYIGKNKLTSKDIHTQFTVVEVMSKLFENPNKWITSSYFSHSSYTSCRSEMSGKVVYPMIKILKEKRNIDIDFKIKGKSSTFELFLDTNNIKIAILSDI